MFINHKPIFERQRRRTADKFNGGRRSCTTANGAGEQYAETALSRTNITDNLNSRTRALAIRRSSPQYDFIVYGVRGWSGRFEPRRRYDNHHVFDRKRWRRRRGRYGRRPSTAATRRRRASSVWRQLQRGQTPGKRWRWAWGSVSRHRRLGIGRRRFAWTLPAGGSSPTFAATSVDFRRWQWNWPDGVKQQQLVLFNRPHSHIIFCCLCPYTIA